MSRLARKLVVPTLVVLVIQFICTVGMQRMLASTYRLEMLTHLYRGIEGAGVLDDCTDRPGPWTPSFDSWTVWPVSPEGVVAGDDAPVRTVTLPAPGQAITRVEGGVIVDIYAAHTPGCGGVVHVLPSAYPLRGFRSSIVATMATLRILLIVVIALALVALTAGPLVRRIRNLSRSMARMVEAGFDGEIEDPAQDELGDVARAFNTAAAAVRDQLERLEHRDAVLRRALADFAHDLRTPLTTLQLSVSGLPASGTSAEMRSELTYLQGMMQNFEAVLAEDREDAIVPVALGDVLERVQQRFLPLAGDRDLSCDLALPDETLRALADPIAAERAVSNLVHNALRFARSHVVVLLFRDGDEVRIEVRDDGPGFGPSLHRAAERGVRGADGAESSLGLGLGLAIAEATARRFGGRLELCDDDNGTMAAVVLPLAKDG